MNSSTSTKSAATGQPSKLKPILIGIVIALIIGVALFAYGYWKGSSQLAAQKADYDSQLQTIKSKLGQSQAELASAQNQTRLFQAQANLYHTAIDLENRNFGIANTHLRESAALLDTVRSAPGLDLARLGALRDAIAKTNINVAVNLAGQRQQVLDFATQLEALTPKTAPPSTSTETATSASTLPDASTGLTSVEDTNAATDANTAAGGVAPADSTNSVPPTGAPTQDAMNSATSVDSTGGSNLAAPSGTAAPAESAPTAAPVG